ncbi:MAG: glycosyltransferase, partial [Melioribacteraceae bacterium]
FTKRLDTLIDWISTGKIPLYPSYQPVRQEGLKRKITPEVVVFNKGAGRIKVSAIISTYNSEKFIEGCLTDLIEQTLYKKGELEIVIVNSGSQQNEEQIIKKFQIVYDNIKYIKTEKETIYSAWNRGIKESTGEYVTNANTDDRHRPEALEIMCGYLEANSEIDVVYADQYSTKIPNDKWGSDTAKKEQLWYEYDPDFLHFGCFIGPQPMWKKNLHDKFGFFNEDLKVVGDYEFWLRISCKAKFYHLPEILGLYYYSTSSAEHRDKTLTESEHSNVQFYYLAKYIQNDADLARIKAKLTPFQSIERMKNYYNSATELLRRREQAIQFEKSIKNHLQEAPMLTDEEVLSKVEYFILEIEAAKLPFDSENYLEILNMFRGAYCLKLGDINVARKSYEKALAANGNSSEACERLGELLMLEENFDAAKAMFEWATKNSPGNKSALKSLSKVNALLGFEEFHNSLA